MSSPGFSPLTMDQVKQWQQDQQAQQMAQALMSGGQQDMNTPYAGMASGGNAMLGAMIGKQMQNQQMQNYQNAMPGTMHDLGGGIGSISDKTPNLQTPGMWNKIAGLFSLGGQ